MNESARESAVAHGVAVASLAAAVLLRWLLDPALGDSLPLVTLFGEGRRRGGRRLPADLVVGLGYLACAYLFIAPRGQFGLDDGRNLVGMSPTSSRRPSSSGSVRPCAAPPNVVTARGRKRPAPAGRAAADHARQHRGCGHRDRHRGPHHQPERRGRGADRLGERRGGGPAARRGVQHRERGRPAGRSRTRRRGR